MQKIYKLDRSQSADILLVGEKAFWLQQLLQHNIPTLSGLVVVTDVYRELLTNFPEFSLPINVDNYKTLRSTARQSRQSAVKIHLGAELFSDIYRAASDFNCTTLILRPSFVLLDNLATPNFYESPVCWCQPQSIEVGIKQIYADIFSAKSLFYWQRQNIGIDKIGLAILIQPLRKAIASGMVIADRESIEIQATLGLGHSIIAGEVVPDRYWLTRDDRKLQNRELGRKITAYYPQQIPNKPKLNDKCLEKISLNDRQQAEFTLNDLQLDRLIELIDSLERSNLIEDRGYTFAWTQEIENETTGETNFYSTEFSLERAKAQPKSTDILTAETEETTTELVGLAASSGKVRARAHIIADFVREFSTIPPNRILVVPTLSTPSLSLLKQAAGVIAETGGMTSHIAIVARELGIPAVLGVINATKAINQGEMLALDGDSGKINSLSNADNEDTATKPIATTLLTPATTIKSFTPSHPTATQLYVSLSQPKSLTHSAISWVDGVGILRSELMLLDLFANKPLREWGGDSEKANFVEYLSDLICRFAKAFTPRPLFYRSLDWCFPNMGVNSFLGRRGTYNYTVDPSSFDLELEALVSAISRGYHNISLVLPFVRSVEEFQFCRRRIEQIGLSDRPSFQLWIMAEVPSVIFQLKEYVEAGVQGIAIGSNDLTQLLLGVDRESNDISKHFNLLHPAMLKALKKLILAANNLGIPATFLGSAAGEHPQLIDLLVEWGIHGISVELEATEKVYRAIDRAEKKILLRKARSIE
jgi:pyruvate, water dikinase